MKSTFGQKLAVLAVAVSMLVSTVFSTRDAYATTTIATPAATVGFVIGGMLIVGGFGSLTVVRRSDASLGTKIGLYFAGALVGFLGIVILDEKNPAVSFAAIDEASAAALGMTQAEQNAYNSEIEELNAVYQSVAAGLMTDENQSAEKAQALWNDYKDYVSADAFSGMAKVAVQFAK